jgi:hypothetical protein
LVSLAEVGGALVQHWSRQDRQVQIWLQQPRKQVRLEIRGCIDHAKPGAAGHFQLEPVRLLHARSVATTISVAPEPGVMLAADRLTKLQPAATGGPFRYETTERDYGAVFGVRRAAQKVGHTRAYSLMKRRGDRLAMATALHVQSAPGELQVSASDSFGAELVLDAPAPVILKSHRRQGTSHLWTLELPPGLPQTVTLMLRGRYAPRPAGQDWALPRLKVEPATLEDHWIGLDGVEPAGKDALTLRLAAADAPGPPDNRPAPPPEMGAAARVGKLRDPQGGLAVRLPASSAGAAPVLFAEQEVFWGGNGWVHHLRVLTFTHSQSDLRVRLPEPARCRAVVTDGRVTVPVGSDLAIPLAGTAGPRLVQVFWTFPDREGPGAPHMDRAVIGGLPPERLMACLWLPPAYHVPADAGGAIGGAADVLLREAEARMRLCALSAEFGAPPASVARAQQEFRGLLFEASARLASLRRTDQTQVAAPLDRQAEGLRRENLELARQVGYLDAARQARVAFPAPPSLAPGENGLPVRWAGDASTPVLPLVSVLDEGESLPRSATELVLLAAVALWLLTYLRHGLALLAALWPETLLGLTLVAISLGGPSPIGIGLAGVAIALRALWLVQLLRRALPARLARDDSDAGSSGRPVTSPPVPG